MTTFWEGAPSSLRQRPRLLERPGCRVELAVDHPHPGPRDEHHRDAPAIAQLAETCQRRLVVRAHGRQVAVVLGQLRGDHRRRGADPGLGVRLGLAHLLGGGVVIADQP
jgi:hypothetical protein